MLFSFSSHSFSLTPSFSPRNAFLLKTVVLVTTLGMALDAQALPPLPANPEPQRPVPPAQVLLPVTAQDVQATAAMPAVAEAAVQSILFNPYGEAEGLRLVNDVIVKFPPHRSQALQATVQPGHRVRILGHAEPGVRLPPPLPDQAPSVVKADAIINVTSGNIVVDQPPTGALPLLPPHLRAQSLQPLQVEGKVELILNGPRGEVDGVILDNQSIVHFSPESLTVPLRPGMRIAAAGLGSKTPAGLSLEALRLGHSAASMQPLYVPAGQSCPSAEGSCP